jgi:hypothetical protein
MGMTRDQFLKSIDTLKFLKKHNYNIERHEKLLKNIEFAKDFFEILDEDDSGVSANELSFPLIALGLAFQASFVK